MSIQHSREQQDDDKFSLPRDLALKLLEEIESQAKLSESSNNR